MVKLFGIKNIVHINSPDSQKPPQITNEFISINTFDELQIFYAPKIIGTGIPFFKGEKGLEEDLGLKLDKIENFGNDVRLTFCRY